MSFNDTIYKCNEVRCIAPEIFSCVYVPNIIFCLTWQVFDLPMLSEILMEVEKVKASKLSSPKVLALLQVMISDKFINFYQITILFIASAGINYERSKWMELAISCNHNVHLWPLSPFNKWRCRQKLLLSVEQGGQIALLRKLCSPSRFYASKECVCVVFLSPLSCIQSHVWCIHHISSSSSFELFLTGSAEAWWK